MVYAILIKNINLNFLKKTLLPSLGLELQILKKKKGHQFGNKLTLKDRIIKAEKCSIKLEEKMLGFYSMPILSILGSLKGPHSSSEMGLMHLI
jgi:hypothetical protein